MFNVAVYTLCRSNVSLQNNMCSKNFCPRAFSERLVLLRSVKHDRNKLKPYMKISFLKLLENRYTARLDLTAKAKPLNSSLWR